MKRSVNIGDKVINIETLEIGIVAGFPGGKWVHYTNLTGNPKAQEENLLRTDEVYSSPLAKALREG